MIIGVGESKNSKCTMNIGTHNGIFHCDEVVGIAILEITYMNTDIHVVRTRNLDELSKLDIVIDIGGGMFDHHMPNFNVRRTTGEKYASAGLVWKKFAQKAITNIMSAVNISIDDNDIKLLTEEIDREIIIPIDMEDNGEKITNHAFSFIPKFIPSWLENSDYNSAFQKVEAIVFNILKEIIKDKIVQIFTQKDLLTRYDNCTNDGILEIPSQTMPWLENVVSYNESHNYKVKFIIFPYPAGGWAAQSVPPSIEKKFEQLISFPKEWAGGTENTLPKISGISDATFCHNGCFFVRAKTKESILKMCRIAMK